MNTQERMDLLAELAETVQGTIRGGWMDYLQVEKEGSRLEGVQCRLRWMDDGTVNVEHDGEVILTARIRVEAEWVPVANEPIGGTLDRTWSTVPAGWFVQTPKGDWLEVTDTHLSGAHQFVGLRINGEVSHWNRPPAGPVKARKGSLSPALRDDALDSLESAFRVAIVQDGEGPMQS